MNKILFLLLIFVSFSCNKAVTPPPGEKDRTVVIYMAGDNNLSSFGRANLIDMLSNYKSNYNSNLLVYIDMPNTNPRLVKIDYDESLGMGVERVIQTYQPEISSDASVLKKRIAEAFELFPAKSYGVILWSHGMGWLPSSSNYPITRSEYRSFNSNVPMTKWFGQDGTSYINIPDLSAALPVNLEFIIFDACFMGGIEVVYELKDNARYIISSAAEILASGFPYAKITPTLMQPQLDLDKLCKQYYDYYNGLSGVGRSATLSLVKTSELVQLNSIVKDIVLNNSSKIPLVDQYAVQQYDRRYDSNGHIFVDFADYIKSISTQSEYALFENQMNKVVLSKYSTPDFFRNENGVYLDNGFPIEKHSGLSVYVPQDRFADLNTAYDNIKWLK